MEFVAKLYQEPGENTYYHSALLFQDPLNPPCFHHIYRHEHLSACFCNLLIGQIDLGISGNSITLRCPRVTVSSMLFARSMLDSLSAFQLSSLSFGLCKSPLQSIQIFGVQNAFRCTMLITFQNMAVDSFDSTDI